MLMVKAGPAVDEFIDKLIPLLEPGDVIIDGGNTPFRRHRAAHGLRRVEEPAVIGTGVSGGEEGALKGPSMMPGGSPAAWPLVKPIFQAIAAKVGPERDIPCCEWVGPRGAGHYVKMVHNGIEYGDMQLICEAYWMLKNALDLSNDELYDVFAQWNRGELDSYLIEITRDIFSVNDDLDRQDLVDKVLDTAGAKGTGKWMSQLALDLGVPSTLVTEAVYARSLSAMKDARRPRQQACWRGPRASYEGDRNEFIEQVRQALYASKICSYAQGFVQMRRPRPSTTGRWISARSPCCGAAAASSGRCSGADQGGLRRRSQAGEPAPGALFHRGGRPRPRRRGGTWLPRRSSWAFPRRPSPRPWPITTATARARLPANLLQAQRDYFGATLTAAPIARARSTLIGWACCGRRNIVRKPSVLFF